MHIARSIVVALGALLLASGCGLGSSPAAKHDIEGVRSCLKDLGLTISKPPADDTDVSDGVFAVSDVQGGDTKQLTVALAANAKTDEAVKQFTADSNEFNTQLGLSKDVDVKATSGSDGRYVWVAMGKEGSKELEDALGCVKPG